MKIVPKAGFTHSPAVLRNRDHATMLANHLFPAGVGCVDFDIEVSGKRLIFRLDVFGPRGNCMLDGDQTLDVELIYAYIRAITDKSDEERIHFALSQ